LPGDDAEDFGGVAFGSDEGPEFLDFAGFADEERTADNAHEGTAHELLFLPDAEFLDGLASGIAEQRKIEPVLFLERDKRFDRIGAHPEDGHAELVELPLCVTKLGRFDGSTGSAGFGKEKKQNALTSEVLESDFFAFVRLQAEGGGFGAYFEHGTFLRSVVESITGIEAHGLGRPEKAMVSRARKNLRPKGLSYSAGLSYNLLYENKQQQISICLRKQLAEDVVYGLRVGLAAGGFHDLADEKFEDAFVSGFELGYVVRVFRDDFTGGLLHGGFTDLRAEAFSGDDLGGSAAGLEHGGEHFFGNSAGDFAGFDELHQFGESGRRNGARADFLAGVFQAAKKFRLHPVGGGFAGSAGFDDGFKIIGESLRAGEDFGVVRRNAVGGAEAGALGFGEFGEGAADFFPTGRADVDGEKIGLWEIAVVVGLFFGPHGDSAAFGLIPQARFLEKAPAGFEDADVALDFELESLL